MHTAGKDIIRALRISAISLTVVTWIVIALGFVVLKGQTPFVSSPSASSIVTLFAFVMAILACGLIWLSHYSGQLSQNKPGVVKALMVILSLGVFACAVFVLPNLVMTLLFLPLALIFGTG